MNAAVRSASGGPIAGMWRWVDLYASQMRISIAVQIQYRLANYVSMVGMIAEPVVYLVVWSTVARQQGGAVAGLTAGDFAAYYIVWTLVRNMNIAHTAGWEGRVQGGDLAVMLLRPIHPFHPDLADLAGWKLVVIVLWLPIAALLSLAFQPTYDIAPLNVAAFLVAIWSAYVLRACFLWLVGMVAFWTTRIGPVLGIYFTTELLLSGRLVPLSLLPTWARDLSGVLPFQWTFSFPIEALIGRLPADRLLGGLAMQVLWIVVGAVLVSVVWHASIRRFMAVGG